MPSLASRACQLRPSSPLVVSAMSSAATLHPCRVSRSQMDRPSSPIPPVTSATRSDIRIPPCNRHDAPAPPGVGSHPREAGRLPPPARDAGPGGSVAPQQRPDTSPHFPPSHGRGWRPAILILVHAVSRWNMHDSFHGGADALSRRGDPACGAPPGSAGISRLNTRVGFQPTTGTRLRPRARTVTPSRGRPSENCMLEFRMSETRGLGHVSSASEPAAVASPRRRTSAACRERRPTRRTAAAPPRATALPASPARSRGSVP